MLSELRIEVNKRCNLSCAHCYTEKLGTVLNIALFESLIENVATRGATSLSLTGGEPLLDVDRALRLAQCGMQNGLKVRLNTNGWLIDDNMAVKLKHSGISEVQVSLSYSDAPSFDAFAGRVGAYDRAILAIKRCVDAGLETAVRFTLLSGNLLHLTPTYVQVAKLAISKFKVRRLVEVNGVSDSAIARPMIVDELRRLRSHADSMRVLAEIAGCDSLSFLSTEWFRRLECKCGALAVFVSADGMVVPCPFLREDSRFWAGNIGLQAFDEIVQSSVFQRFIGDRDPVAACGHDMAGSCKAMGCCQASDKNHVELQSLA